MYSRDLERLGSTAGACGAVRGVVSQGLKLQKLEEY